MYLDQKVTIFCTDRDTKSEGKIVRMNNLGIDVEISGAIIKFKKTKPKHLQTLKKSIWIKQLLMPCMRKITWQQRSWQKV